MSRAAIVRETRRLLGTPYAEGIAPTTDDNPVGVDCSGFVRTICLRLYGDDSILAPGSRWPYAEQMFERLAPVCIPQAGDLALYSHPQGASQRWHVMVVTEHGGVVGACNERGCVTEYDYVQYGKAWAFRGFREFSIEENTQINEGDFGSVDYNVFVRFGDPPKNGRSMDHSHRRRMEDGTSCFDAIDVWTGDNCVGWRPEARSRQNKKLMKAIIGVHTCSPCLGKTRKRVWLLFGQEIGIDSDGEPMVGTDGFFSLTELAWDASMKLFFPPSR